MKVVVTGGAGFIGSHITDKLINNGDEVVIVDDLSTGRQENINGKAKFYKIDIQSPELESIFEKEHPDYVCHQAAQKDVRISVSDPIYDARINILGTLNLLQNCIKYNVKKVVFASTGGAIYGEQEVFPVPETHPTRPISPYGVAKLVAEHYLYYYKTIYGLDYVSLRYANVYGPRQDPHGEAGVVAIFIQKMLNGEQPIINGDGEQTRDFVYVDDVARANILAIRNNSSENVFNIGTGIETTVTQLFIRIRESVAPSIEEKHGVAKEGEQLRSVIDFTQAKKILKWEPIVSLDEGLEKTLVYFKSVS
ncbi:MAG: SDR family oxidoreductase [Nitrospirae bacterium]|nr:SDR family oxidoreductase [Nitrospirota bacterium]